MLQLYPYGANPQATYFPESFEVSPALLHSCCPYCRSAWPQISVRDKLPVCLPHAFIRYRFSCSNQDLGMNSPLIILAWLKAALTKNYPPQFVQEGWALNIPPSSFASTDSPALCSGSVDQGQSTIFHANHHYLSPQNTHSRCPVPQFYLNKILIAMCCHQLYKHIIFVTL